MHDPVPPLARQVLALLADIEITLLVSNGQGNARAHLQAGNEACESEGDEEGEEAPVTSCQRSYTSRTMSSRFLGATIRIRVWGYPWGA